MDDIFLYLDRVKSDCIGKILLSSSGFFDPVIITDIEFSTPERLITATSIKTTKCNAEQYVIAKLMSNDYTLQRYLNVAETNFLFYATGNEFFLHMKNGYPKYPVTRTTLKYYYDHYNGVYNGRN